MTLSLLGACATKFTPPEQPVDLPAQVQRIADISHWQLRGKIAISDGQEKNSANLYWQVRDVDYGFKLTNPLGVTVVELEKNGSDVSLNADDQVYSDTNAERLVYNTTGWQLPIADLLKWIRGIPGTRDDYTLNEYGLLASLTPNCQSCLQWHIRYSRYRQVDGLWMPHQIELQHVSEPNRWIKIKANKWTLDTKPN